MNAIRKIGLLVVVMILTLEVNSQQFTVLKKECINNEGMMLGKYQSCKVTFNNNTEGQFYIVDNVYKLLIKRTLYDEIFNDYSNEEYVIWALYRKLNGYLDYKEDYLVKLKENEIKNNRIQQIKNTQIGDMICYTQDFVHHEDSESILFITTKDEVNVEYTMTIKFYVENKVNDRLFLRVVKVTSNNKNYSATPKFKEIELYENTTIWLLQNDFFLDTFWKVCN